MNTSAEPALATITRSPGWWLNGACIGFGSGLASKWLAGITRGARLSGAAPTGINYALSSFNQ